MKSQLRIAAHLGVKDEIELIEPCIAHLRSIGVEHIMVCDMSSTDGTTEILQKYRSDNFDIVTLTTEEISGEVEDDWNSYALRRSQNAPADWVIFLDADEFWLPASGSLRDCAALQTADVLQVERYNVVLGPDGPFIPSEIKPENYESLLVYAERVPDLWREMRKNPELPWLTAKVMPKVMVRPSKLKGLTPGQHDVLKADDLRRQADPPDLIIAHLPISTPTRLKKKIDNIRSIYTEVGLDITRPGQRWQDSNALWHWRRWASLPEWNDEFERNSLDSERVLQLRLDGTIKSAREMLTPAGR